MANVTGRLDTDPLEALRTRIRERTATVAIVGLGYVGIPLAASVHGSGFRVIGIDADEGKLDRLRARRSPIADVAGLRDRGDERGDVQREPRFARLGRRDRDVPADPARRRRSRSHDGAHRRRGRRSPPASGRARRAGVDDVPGHHRGAAAADPRDVGVGRRQGLRARLLPGAHRPREPAASPRHHAEDRRRAHRPVQGDRGLVLRDVRHDRRDDVLAARGRDGQADREHVPAGEHRPWSTSSPCTLASSASTSGSRSTRRPPSRSATSPSGRGPGVGGTLHLDRPDLPVVAGGPAARPPGRVHRARERGQQPHARLRGLSRVRCLERRREADQGGPRVLGVGVAFKPGIDDLRESPLAPGARSARRQGGGGSHTTTRSCRAASSAARSWRRFPLDHDTVAARGRGSCLLTPHADVDVPRPS